jgi:hypothetical protein
MSRNTYVLVAVALLLGICYSIFFTDWFRSPPIQIIPQIRPGPSKNDVYPVTFTFDHPYQLTYVKVVERDAYLTNKNALPLWYLVTKSNSVPVQGMTYGVLVRGMSPFSSNTPPATLQPGVSYRLLLKAGRAKGEVDFQTRAVSSENG